MGRIVLCLAMILTVIGVSAGQKPGPAVPPPQAPIQAPTFPERETMPSSIPTPEALQTTFEAKVKAEWEAIKNRDKEAFSKLLTDDFIAVEDDAEGARNRYRAANEVPSSMVHSYTLERFRAFALSPDVTFVKYESTMAFPSTAVYRYKRIWISEIWVRRGDDWKMWRYQETRVK